MDLPLCRSPSQCKRRAGEALPPELEGAGTAAILALIMFLAPALGVPHEQMLQDTLKSIIVSFGALGAALLFFWRAQQRDALRWHAVIVLPVLLMAYALGSMAWSHTYLAGVEAIRWFLFALAAVAGPEHLVARAAAAARLGDSWRRRGGFAVGGAAVLGQFQPVSAGPTPGIDLRQSQLLCRVRGLLPAVRGAADRPGPAKRPGRAADRQRRPGHRRHPDDRHPQRADRVVAATRAVAALHGLAVPAATGYSRMDPPHPGLGGGRARRRWWSVWA